MNSPIYSIRTIGWYSDNSGVGKGGERLYTYWNGFTWSARAHSSWSSEDAGRQALVPSTHAPVNPKPVGHHEYALPRSLYSDILNSMREILISIDARVLLLEVRPDVSRQIESVLSDIRDIRSGLFAAAGGEQ
jgi:hypothetical protein